MKPTFIIIGAMKAGTTSLWRYLDNHPEVFMSPVKEIDFFSANWDRGMAWYESHFADASPDVKALGEASTTYSRYPYYPEVPERIATCLPDVRLIYILRDPIERIRSMWVHLVSSQRETRTIEAAMTYSEHNDYIHQSMYYLQLECYLQHFPLRQILIITTEALRNQPDVVLRQVFEFVGVDQEFQPPSLNLAENESTRLRRQPNHLGIFLAKFPRQATVVDSLPYRAKKLYERLTTTPIGKPDLSPNLRETLIALIQPDTNRLRALLGRDFTEWSI